MSYKYPEDFINKIICGDCLEVTNSMPESCIDTIFTDPPYPIEYIDCWEKLGILACRILKPSGLLVTYSGHIHLDKVIPILNRHLKYYWQLILLHKGHTQLVLARNLIASYKPILIYQKPPFKKLSYVTQDKIVGSGREKELHKWQQAEFEACEILRRFTNDGDLILDPFAGTGTIARATKDLHRNFIGIEINPNYCKIANERLAQGVL